jgi:hypothetical protein
MAEIPQIMGLEQQAHEQAAEANGVVVSILTSSEEKHTYSCAADAIPGIVAFFVGCANSLPDRTPPGARQVRIARSHTPIAATGLGFATSGAPGTGHLIVRLRGFDLTFAVGTSELRLLRDRLDQAIQRIEAGTPLAN